MSSYANLKEEGKGSTLIESLYRERKRERQERRGEKGSKVPFFEDVSVRFEPQEDATIGEAIESLLISVQPTRLLYFYVDVIGFFCLG